MSNQFANLGKAKHLLADSKTLRTFNADFAKHTGQRNIDKFNKGFNFDDRFKCFSVNVYFGAYSGSYGSSSVDSFLRLKDSNNVGQALITYLRENEEEILQGMATILERKARELTAAAKAEVAEATKFIESIEEQA